MGSSVETRVESARLAPKDRNAGLCVRMFGPLAIVRDGSPLKLPASRKVRALLAYLALAAGPVDRGRLCELLWDAPDDPRGELRWHLSKLRRVLDEPHRRRVVTLADTIAVRLDDCEVDAIIAASAAEKDIATLAPDRLRALEALFAGGFLDGLEIDRSPNFNAWLTAQRRRFRACHVAVLERLVGALSADEAAAAPYLEKWLELSPFDRRAHALLLKALFAGGKVNECERHLAATALLFQSEGLDFGPVRAVWRGLKARPAHAPRYAEAIVSIPPAMPDLQQPDGLATRRASIAVMPFSEGADGGFGYGLTDDVITRLAKLRCLFVIARGSVFTLARRGASPEEAGRQLNVDYVASGAVRRRSGRVVVSVELVEARTDAIVWADVFDVKPDDTFDVLDRIVDSIVSSISAEVERVERNRAVLKAPNSLNAWEAYHRGLWHMYRFTKAENERARRYFQMAVRLDRTFAPGHSGLSFTHWQSAFQHWGDDREEAELANQTAAESLLVDDHDPGAHWAMGRALWLRGRQDDALRELETTVEISPNFALGHYTLGFVRSQSGDAKAAIGSLDLSRNLSPFDPLLFAMLASRALAHARLHQYEEAAEWAVKAATRPNAHNIVLATAAHCLALAGRFEEGRAFAAAVRRTAPNYTAADLLASYRFNPDGVALFQQVARQVWL